MFQLDLAFDATGITLSPSEECRLTEESWWTVPVQEWIETIRCDLDLECPILVRQADEISLGLRLTDDTNIAELNGIWRERPEPTDVLSFAALDQTSDRFEAPCIELGDIIVSLETARRQAIEQAHSLSRELDWLVTHGLLHLLGWDHPDDASLKRMLAVQEHLLENRGNVQARGIHPVDANSIRDAH
ncbi:MAG: rRNA maturation RNase YbeY [Cyanobium sp. NAT70]|nr:rRNA maturation RNase YbeY [Cyanobium sp. NAT70]